MDEKIGYVYLTTNLVNGKQYVGQHLSDGFDNYYKGSGKALKYAFEKYGWDNFTCEVLQWCSTQTQLNEVEDNCIRLYGTMVPHGYNLRGGGANGKFSKEARKNVSRGHKKYYKSEEGVKSINKCRETIKKYYKSEEGAKARKKMSETKKSFYESEEGEKVRNRISESLKKYFESDESRKKASEASKKIWENEDYRKKASEARKGQVTWNKGKTGIYSEETRRKIAKSVSRLWDDEIYRNNVSRKISMANKGRKHTEEARKKMSEAQKGHPSWNKGKHHTEETRKKMSESSKKKKILQYTKDGVFVKEWKSIQDAYKTLKIRHISECCMGKLKSAGGFIWRYK